VLSELFDCETEYDDNGEADSHNVFPLETTFDDSTVMHYSDDKDDYSGCLLPSSAFAMGHEGDDGNASSGCGDQSPSSSMDLTLKLEAFSPMSSFDTEPVPPTPEFYLNKDDVFK